VPVKSGRILIVEDNHDNITLLTDILETLEHTVIQARDGQRGVELATLEQPDLILMDLSLPVVDGWDAVRQIKANPALSHIPIIALTAHAMTGDRERALAAGCDDYLSKPIDLSLLTVKITKHLA
jgi:two-component system, cell cycle response regulator DivK